MATDPTGVPQVERAEDAYTDTAPFEPFARAPLLERTVPVARELPKYQANKGRRDLLAGLTVAALAIPSAIAYAELAGLSPANGLYALLLPALAYVLFGSSRQLVVGPEGSISALVAAAIIPLAAAGSPEAVELAGMLSLLVAGFFAAAYLLRLSWIADYLSRPVLVGYIHGVAIVLIIGQIEKLAGLSIDANDPLPQLWEALKELDEVSGATLTVGLIALAILLGLRRVAPRLPSALAVVIGAIALSWAFDFESHGIAVLGDIPSGLPSLMFPTPPLEDTLKLIPAALGIAALCFADGILTARSFAGKNGQQVRASQEMLAFIGVQAASGVSGGFPVGASGSRTAVNDAMGARTQIAGLFAAATVVIVLLFLTGPIAYLPKAVLGAIIVTAAIGLLDISSWKSVWTVHRVEGVIALITTVGVVGFGVIEALIVAVLLTLVDAVRRSARPHDAVLGWVDSLGRYADISLHPSAKITQGVVVYRLDDRLFFANAQYVTGRIREAINGAPQPVEWLILDAEAVTHVDVTGIDTLRSIQTTLEKQGVRLVLARAKTQFVARLDTAGIVGEIGAEHFYPTVRDAVRAYGVRSEGPSSVGAP